jgi:formamidopyrimidine-DNA glycosylase
VLAESIAAGGSTIRDYAQPNGELGYFASISGGLWPRRRCLRCGGGTVQRTVPGRAQHLLVRACQK